MIAKSIRFLRLPSPLIALAIVAACGSKAPAGFSFVTPGHDGGGNDGGTLTDSGGDDGPSLFQDGGSTLVLDPANVTLFIDTATTPPTPATQAYTATYNGTDVTSQLALTLQNTALGSFSGQAFTSATTIPGGVLGVTTEVQAAADGQTAAGNLTLVALNKTGPNQDFYFVVPYQQPPTPPLEELTFSTKLQSIDVAMLLDTTGSMGASISNVQTNLTKAGGILDGLQAAIPNVGIAIVDHRDFPYGGYGGPGDFPVKVWQTITTSAAAAQAAVANYSVGDGADDPEAQIPAMDYLLTGNALTWPTGSVAAHTPAPGTQGGVDFRPGSFRVVVQITDAPWHNYDGTPADPLATPYSFSTPDYNQLATDFTTFTAKYVGIVDDHSQDTHPHVESQTLSDATQSNVPVAAYPGGACNPQAGSAANGNCRLNFDINNGVGLDTSVVQAIQAISVGAYFNITAIPANDPTNANGVDATKFIAAIQAIGAGDPANNCPPLPTTKSQPGLMYDDVFVGVTTGTAVCFNIIAATNTTVPATTAAQFYNAFINVVGLPGNTTLDQRKVLFLVPPADLGGQQ
jgi:hypothetical protein